MQYSNLIKEAKEVDEVCSSLGGLGVQSFQPDEHEIVVKVVLNLQEEVKKLKKDNDKLMENLSKQEEIESRLMTQERDLNAF